MSVAPDELARELADAGDADWLRELVDALDREMRTAPLQRFVSRWDLTNAAAARTFGISRQAFSKWLTIGPPASRADEVAAVDDITNLLDRYVKRERIPAVVRRPAALLGGSSIVEALEAGRFTEAVEMVRSAFDLRRVQP